MEADLERDMDELVRAARDAGTAAYAPYSGFAVGAAVETADGTVYTGCNVETVNYSNTLHAEEVAVGKAVSAGHRGIDRVAVSGSSKDGLRPCGMCRQTLAEFCSEDATVLCDEGQEAEPSRYRMGELLPHTMAPTDLGVDPDAD
jgi:cytidine deaminase